jgi:CBS domain containing-hemolysin-like protein
VTEVALLVVALALVAACAVFVAAEFSLTTVENSAVERAAHAGERGASTALKAVNRLTFELSGAQLGITLTSLLIGMLAEPSVAALLRGPLGAVGLSDSAAQTAALVLGIVLSTVVLMVLGELVPKNWAISRPLPVAKVVAGPLYYFSAAFSPLIGHLNNTANRFVRRRGLEPAEHLGGPRSPAELMAMARHSSNVGALDPDTADMFIRALRLRHLTARHVMTPRVDIKALSADASATDVAVLTRDTGMSQFPVYRENLDDIVGVVHVKSALAVPVEQRCTTAVVDLLTDLVLVPETLAADHLLDRLREQETLAVVIDEYGGIVGIVTLEDIVEEVVGSVSDEHDSDDIDPLVELPTSAEGRQRWRADGNVRTDQLASLGVRDPDGPYETLAGLIANELDRIPVPGDQITVDGWQFDVETVAHHVAERVQITGPVPSDDAGDSPGADQEHFR